MASNPPTNPPQQLTLNGFDLQVTNCVASFNTAQNTTSGSYFSACTCNTTWGLVGTPPPCPIHSTQGTAIFPSIQVQPTTFGPTTFGFDPEKLALENERLILLEEIARLKAQLIEARSYQVRDELAEILAGLAKNA